MSTIMNAAVSTWFKKRKWKPWKFQTDSWQAYADGESGLLSVPTGSGKTLAAVMGPWMEWMEQPTEGMFLIYIAPLRALSRDIERSLKETAAEIGINMRIESRTGDTSSARRTSQKKHPPHMLLTTPESLAVLLTQPYWRIWFRDVRCVVMDEWHELFGNKRGALLELNLTRLRSLRPEIRTWALSATIGNLEEAAQFAVGNQNPYRLVRQELDRPVILRPLLPTDPKQIPWSGFIGIRLISTVMKALDREHSTLIFTNTRSQAERWFQEVLDNTPVDFHSRIAIHHGSLDRDDREHIEAGVVSGEIKWVVCTSSLDLGVDFQLVDRVIQIGSPKSVTRVVQRAGRASHRPMASSHLDIVPTHALELLDIAACRTGLAMHTFEPRIPPLKPIDVLIQHLGNVALAESFTREQMWNEVTAATSFANLTRVEFDWCLKFLTEGGDSLRAYPQYHKLLTENDIFIFPDERKARVQRMNVGTITSEQLMHVKFQGGKSIGQIEESFIGKLHKGDTFVFAGRSLELTMVHNMTAFVRLATASSSLVPRWGGTLLPISEHISRYMRQMLASMKTDTPITPELEMFQYFARAQSEMSAIPTEKQLLVETLQDKEGFHIFLYPFEGKLVHEGLGSILAWRLSRDATNTFAISVQDHGLELLAAKPVADVQGLLESSLRSAELQEDFASALNLSELAKREFRSIARISGLVIESAPGRQNNVKQLQISSSLLFEVFQKYDPENLLYKQAYKDVLNRHFEGERLTGALDRILNQQMILKKITQPTPLALPLIIERVRDRVSTESLLERVERLQKIWQQEATHARI